MKFQKCTELMGLRELQRRLQHTCIVCRGLRILILDSLLSDLFYFSNFEAVNWDFFSVIRFCIMVISSFEINLLDYV